MLKGALSAFFSDPHLDAVASTESKFVSELLGRQMGLILLLNFTGVASFRIAKSLSNGFNFL